MTSCYSTKFSTFSQRWSPNANKSLRVCHVIVVCDLSLICSGLLPWEWDSHNKTSSWTRTTHSLWYFAHEERSSFERRAILSDKHETWEKEGHFLSNDSVEGWPSDKLQEFPGRHVTSLEFQATQPPLCWSNILSQSWWFRPTRRWWFDFLGEKGV
jgi:hypothetical protein